MNPAPDISVARGARAGVRLDRGLGPRLALAECDDRAADGEHRDKASANTPRAGRPEPRPFLPGGDVSCGSVASSSSPSTPSAWR
jgi:hypothetical protein